MAPDIDVAPAAPLSAVARSAAVPEGGGSADRPVIGAADERQEAATARTSSLETRPAAHVQLHSPHLPTFPSHHGSPFAAVAALLAASLQRAERGGATHTHLDVLLPDSHAGSCLAEESGDRQGHAAGSAATAGAEASAAAQQAEPELPHQGHQDVKAPAASQSTAAGPSLMHSQQQPVLRIQDDAAGLSPQQLRRSLGIPSLANSASSLVAADTGGASLGSACRHAASSPASQWPDFVHAALRLGSTVLVLTKRQGRGASVGLLHASPAPSGRGEAWLEAAVLDFLADGSWRLTPGGAAINQATPSNASAASALAWHAAAAAAAAETAGSAWTAAAGMICQRWPDGASEAQLAAELAAMPDQGTCLLIAGLYTRAMGDAGTAGAAGAAYELDWSTDPSDVQLGEDSAQQGGQQPPQQRQQQQQQQQQQGSGRPLDPELQRCTLLRSSLRAYMAVLFLRWPEGWRLRLRGTDVEQQRIRDWMRWPAREEYRPRGIRDEVDEHGFQMQHVVSIHLGMLRDAPNTSMQGICIYHRNRLVKPFWRVYSSATVGRGVIGLLEADFLAPTPDWQDFERSHVLSKLEAFLKRAIPSYYKRHVHLLTGGLPQAKRGPGRQYPGQAAGEAAGPLKGMQMAGIGLQGSQSAHHGGLCLQPQQHMLLAVQRAQRAQLAAALPGQQHVHQPLALPALSFGISGPAAGAAQPQHSLAAIMQGLLASLSAASQPAPLPAQIQGTAVQQQPGPPPDLGRALLIAAQQVAGPAAALAAALQQAQQAQGQQQELLQAVLALLAEQAAAPPAGPASSALLSSFQPQRQPLQHPQPAPAPLPPSPFGAVQSSAAALLSQLQQLANAGSAPPVSAPMQAQLLQQLGALAESSESGRLASTALGEPGDMHRLSSSGTQAVPTLAPAGQLQLQAQQQQQQQQQQHVQQQHMGNLHMAAQAPGGQPKPAACFVRKGVDPASSRPNSRPSSPKRRRHA